MVRLWLDGFGIASYEVEADGPWEAVFRFCGLTGYRPERVTVDPPFRCPDGIYCCTVRGLP